MTVPGFASGEDAQPVRQVAPPPGDPQTASADQEAFERDAREQALLARPAAREERVQSQDAYQDQSRSEALATARAAFGDFIDVPLWSPPELPNGERIGRYANDHAAIIEGPGPDLMLESLAPLRAATESGTKAPVDSSLVAEGDALAPANVPLDATIAKDPAGGVALTHGIHVRAAGSGSGADAAVVDDKAFFANVGDAADTDLIVAAAPQGVEVAFQLRSADSPDDPALAFDLPAGAALRVQNDLESAGDAPQGAATVVRDGENLLTVLPPVASDADGQPIAASYEARGSELLVRVDHRGEDVHYPILVDPYIVENYNGNEGDFYNANNPGPKWEYYEEDPDFNGSQGGTAPGGTGLRLNMPTNPPSCCTYPAGDSAQWQWEAPANTQIVRADFQRVAHDFNSSLVRIGILGWVPSLGQFKWQGDPAKGNAPWVITGLQTDVSRQICTDIDTPCASGGASDANWAIFQFESTGGGNPRARSNYTAMNQVITYLWDKYPPTVAPASVSNQAQAGWVDDKAYGIPLTANDLGLGVKSVELKSSLNQFPSAINSAPASGSPCTGELRSSRCPNQYASTLYYATTALPEGDNTISLTARDIVGGTSGGTCSNGTSDPCRWHVKVDRTPPSIASISGPLWDHRNQTADHRAEGLYSSSYQLSVNASDANNGRPTAGLKTISVQVDGVTKYTKTASCAGEDNCADTASWTLNADDYTDGDHTVTVVAKDALADQPGVDNARHTKTSSFPITVDRRGDVYHVSETTGPPGDSGTVLLSEEWARSGGYVSRREQADLIQTRSAVSCSSGTCDQVRIRSRDGEVDPTSRDSFSVYTGISVVDKRLPNVSVLVEHQQAPPAGGTSSGPINAALATWQRPPPAHGDTYDMYVSPPTDGLDERVYMREWLDHATHMPLKQEFLETDGSVTETHYWSYDVGRLGTTEVPSNFFSLDSPANVSYDQYVTMQGNQTVGLQQDQSTGSLFQPFYLGIQTELTAGHLCLVSVDTARDRDLEPSTIPNPAPTDPPDEVDPSTRDLSMFTTVDAYYNLSSAPCDLAAAGRGDISAPNLEVVSLAKGSPEAAEERDAFVDLGTATPVIPGIGAGAAAGIPRVAYVTSAPQDDTSAFIDLDTTSVLITGDYQPAELSALVTDLETR